MSGYARQRNDIITRFDGLWGTGNPVSPTPPVAYPNRDFSPPSPASPWGRLSIISGEEEHAGVAGTGQGEYRNVGFVDVSCFVPTGSGQVIAYNLADHAISIFRGLTLTEIFFTSGQVIELPEETESAWYGVSGRAHFMRTRIETYTA